MTAGRTNHTKFASAPTAYKQRANEQSRAWVNGDCKHNDVDDECCPDFSCCFTDLFTKDRGERVRSHNIWAVRNGFPRVE